MAGEMSFEELQQIVSVCLDEITSLKDNHEEMTKLMNAVYRTVTNLSNMETVCQRLNHRMYKMQSRVSYLANREKILNSRIGLTQTSPTRFLGKGVVYSAITGGYDNVKEIRYKNPNLDYILFTDNPNIKSDTWDVRMLSNPEHLDSVRLARRTKIMGHELLQEYDYSVWVDGKLEIIGDFVDYIERYRDTRPILCFNHYVDDCVYAEVATCKQLKKDDPATMDQQVQQYREEGYPSHNGLIESAILVRELHDEGLIKVMTTWWDEVLHKSFRDQLSFNYACWKNNFLYDTTDLFVYENDYVTLHAHS